MKYNKEIPMFSEKSKEELYKVKDVKNYVDRYAKKHHISVSATFDHVIVRTYVIAKFKKSNMKGE